MQTKALEIRDRCTRIMAVAISTQGTNLRERQAFKATGYATTGGPTILLITLDKPEAHNDPYDWPYTNRTMRIAHSHIEAHWDDIAHGEVIDVRYISGEEPTAALPEVFV